MNPKLLTILISFLIIILTGSSCHNKIVSTNNQETYDNKISLRLMLLNDYTYEKVAQTSTDYHLIKNSLEKQVNNNKYTKDYEIIWLGITNNNDNLSYILKSKYSTPDNNILILVNRGTVLSLLDIKEDLEVYSLVKWNTTKDKNIKISQGLNKALQITNSLTSDIFNVSSTSVDKLTISQLLTKEISNNNKTLLYITGHSLGGAITTAISLQIIEKYIRDINNEKLTVSTYNFAGQTVGNKSFANYYNNHLNTINNFNYYRIINPYDVVPFAFNDLNGITSIGYPFSKLGLLEVSAVIKIINEFVTGKEYMHVGGRPIKLNAVISTPPSCSKEVTSIISFSCWATYQHQPFHYVDLLK